MRLFLALNFSNEVKSQIKEVIDRLRTKATKGNFVKEEHMHLTLEFLGEVPEARLNKIKEIMDRLEFEKFTLKPSKPGYFNSREGKIYWLGLEHNPALFQLHEKLHDSLKQNGFDLEDREYKPHITLGRKVVLKDSFNFNELDDIIRKIKIDICKVDLMKSEFKNGSLIHTRIYSK